MNIEERTFTTEVRALSEEDGKRYLEGKPIVYNKESRYIADGKRVFKEKINTGALTDTLQRENLNVKAVWMHERGQLLGTTRSGTLSLTEDEDGVSMRLSVPNTTLGNDIYELVQRGDITEMSFKFALGNNEYEAWSRNAEGDPLREISRIGHLFDVSFVDEGAYADTEVAVRSLQEFEESYEVEEEDQDEYLIENERDLEEITLLSIKK